MTERSRPPGSSGRGRDFTIHAVEVEIVLNTFGLHMPHGAMYVLEEDLEAVRAADGEPLDDAHALLEEGKQKDPSVIQPLVVRANKGETIEIEFVNHLDRHASIHQTALPYDVRESDGMAVGYNPDTTVAPGERTQYRWEATHVGTHFFCDGANQAFESAPGVERGMAGGTDSALPRNEDGDHDTAPTSRDDTARNAGENKHPNLLARGLFGAVVVEPEGATWTDPRTGGELRSGVRAVVHDPATGEDDVIGCDTSYREFVLFYHTPEGVYPEFTWPHSGVKQSTHGINYRSDPSGMRVNDDCEDCGLEELFYHSWTNGDPGGGDSVYTAYKGDPIKFCFVGASQEENHVHHLHQHRYKEIPRTDAATVDAQTIGLGDTYEAYLVAGHGPGTVRPDTSFEEAFTESGAGYTHGTAGDVLFHCHMFPHYAEGMWAFMRVLDKEHDFLEPLPGTDIVDDSELDRADLPLQDAILSAESDVPGFPEFIGDAIKKENDVDDPIGHGAPEAPNLSVTDPREPTAMERAALGDEILRGAPYTDPTDEPESDRTDPTGNPKPTRILEYTIAVMEAEIAYNDSGEHDPDGIVYVLEEANVSPGPGKTKADVVGVTDGPVLIEDAERVRTGEMNPEPLFLRANVGDRVEVRLRNELDTIEMGEERPFDASIHPHYVGYDVLGSDSLSNGFNYYQGTEPDGTNESRWYADEEGTIFFHDHIFAIVEGMHGMFCGLIVEPAGSEWRDPYSDERIFSGAQATISTPEDAAESDFREQALHYHDFAPLRDGDGEYVNKDSEHNVNKGTMAINYRNAPYYNRDNEDSAYVHSSAVHGDPPTPVIEAYENDPIRLRLFQGCYEEQHTFGVHGLRIDRRGVDTADSVSKLFGTSEAFTFDIEPETTQLAFDHMTNPDGLPVRDYRYGSNVVDDLWCGMWGLVRIWGGEVGHLAPLPDHGAPTGTIADDELRTMGHPAPFSDFDWTEAGQRAKHLYSIGDERTLGGVASDIADDLSDELLPDIDSIRHVERSVQRQIGDLGSYSPPGLPANRDARRNSSIGDVPPTPGDDDEGPGDPPPEADAEVREFDVTALRTEIPYNDYGDHDPHGIVFALDRHVEEIKSGTRDPEPLILRANAGERIRLTLTNGLEGTLDNDHPHPKMQIPQQWERSDRISLHPLELQYDVNGSNGATIGFNYDTTVGRGDDEDDTITYEWYADGAVDTICLWDMADLRSNRHHGAFGQLFVEPADATALDEATAEPVASGPSAIVKTSGRQDDFREHGLVFGDGQFVVNRHDPPSCVVPRPDPADPKHDLSGEERRELRTAPCNLSPPDSEDQGYGGINYRSEPFVRRFENDDLQHRVYSSVIHGDPNTPVIEAAVGDPVRLRVACAGDKARAIAFHLAGHQWQRHRGIDESPTIGVDGQFGPGKAETVELIGGAGGPDESGGDFVYQETKQRRWLESGLWGIFRVHDGAERPPGRADGGSIPHGGVQPLPDRSGDVPLADRPGFVVRTGDVTGSGDTDVVVGVPDSDVGAVDAGAVYVFVDTPPERITDLSAAELQVPNETADERAGTDVTLTGGTDDGADDIVVETTAERIVTIRGGRPLCDLIDSPPSSVVAEFVRKSTTTDVTSIVPLDAAGDG
jgi:FtsP/CotA-like multicopper oxidase with cupredoxin domain